MKIPTIVRFGGEKHIEIPIDYKILSKEKKLVAILGNRKVETDFENINTDLEKIIEEIREENCGNSRVLVETTFMPIEDIELEII